MVVFNCLLRVQFPSICQRYKQDLSLSLKPLHRFHLFQRGFCGFKFLWRMLAVPKITCDKMSKFHPDWWIAVYWRGLKNYQINIILMTLIELSSNIEVQVSPDGEATGLCSLNRTLNFVILCTFYLLARLFVVWLVQT